MLSHMTAPPLTALRGGPRAAGETPALPARGRAQWEVRRQSSRVMAQPGS
jgi:hypothetical protein